MKVNEILNYVNSIAPVYMKYEWDNAGLLCGDPAQEVHKILVALDPFEHVCREAAEIGADLIVTHHPLIFRAPKSITTGDSVGRSILFLASHGISAMNAHTNLDCAPGGVNEVLAQTLGLRELRVIEPVGTDEQGRSYGLLRAGITDEQPLDAFLSVVKNKLGTPVLRYAKGRDTVRCVAVGGGACADGLLEALEAGCDTLVTADVKYNQFWDAHDLGINLIDAGHFYTENPVCTVLAAGLQAKFPEISVVVSQNHRDCMEFF